ncbi:MAG: hypothetical protein K2M31_03455, partial [Muribaculaceae bacterium]|nr:hypothetical protein [Muribaculaceae bacterium]
MRKIFYLIFAVIALCVASCADSSSRYNREINSAEMLMQTNVDSAMAILDHIDPSNLKVDSLRAKYYYLLAFGHMRQNRSMIGDSLVAFAHN